MSTVQSPAFLIRLLRKTGSNVFQTPLFYKSLVLCLTFISYASYHVSRRPLSVVKAVLNKDCINDTIPFDVHVDNETVHSWCDWERKFIQLNFLTSQLSRECLLLLVYKDVLCK